MGSFPLTRGKRRGTTDYWSCRELIPAHAGKTSRPPCPASSHSAHPRSHGENYGKSCVPFCAMGSSPLTRGKLEPFTYRRSLWGLIPAHAGKTFQAELEMIQERLIPAHAGKTTDTRSTRAHHRAHPRSRGENQSGDGLRDPLAGSSPLTRGKHRGGGLYLRHYGLIPAHAGKTGAYWPSETRPWAHPRSRGENIKAAVSVVVEWGSSPLTRGKLAIPSATGSNKVAHPRSRGENGAANLDRRDGQGSSPLTRGKQ